MGEKEKGRGPVIVPLEEAHRGEGANQKRAKKSELESERRCMETEGSVQFGM